MSVQPKKDGFLLESPSLVPITGPEAYEAQERALEQPITPPPPPNGGVVAWLQVAGAFFLFFNSW